MNSGAGGKITFPICEWNMWRSHGNFIYGESKYNGFVLIDVQKEMIEVKYKGVTKLDKPICTSVDPGYSFLMEVSGFDQQAPT